MSKNRNRKKTSKCLTSREYTLLQWKELGPYYDEGWYYYTTKSKHNNGYWKTKKILAYQVRQYRSWKHNRKKQYNK